MLRTPYNCPDFVLPATSSPRHCHVTAGGLTGLGIASLNPGSLLVAGQPQAMQIWQCRLLFPTYAMRVAGASPHHHHVVAAGAANLGLLLPSPGNPPCSMAGTAPAEVPLPHNAYKPLLQTRWRPLDISRSLPCDCRGNCWSRVCFSQPLEALL